MNIKMIRSLKEVGINELGFYELYCFDEKVYVRFYNDSLAIIELDNAMKKGREVKKHIIYIKGDRNKFKELFFNYLFDLNVSFVEFVSKLKRGEVKETDKFGIEVVFKKGIRVFNPFYIPKKIKEPSTWRISHVVNGILSGQIIKGECVQHLTDDYAYDAAVNFRKGCHIDILQLCRDLVESPSGWRVHFYKEEKEGLKIIEVNLCHFNYNKVYYSAAADERKVCFDELTTNSEYTA